MSTKRINLSDPQAVAAATDEQFEKSRAAAPWYSLQYKHACDRMTDGQFEASRAAEPGTSLIYEHACDRMTDEQFEKSRAASPGYSLYYKHDALPSIARVAFSNVMPTSLLITWPPTTVAMSASRSFLRSP